MDPLPLLANEGSLMRQEYKFLVPLSEAPLIRRTLLRYAQRDPHCLGMPQHRYTVRSVYYDTRRAAIYREKVEGLSKRTKVRLRGYNSIQPDSLVVAELKHKSGSGSWKDRAHGPLREMMAWLDDTSLPYPGRPSGRQSADRFVSQVRRHALAPVQLVTYEREAFVGVHDPTLRVTFDSSLRGRRADHIEDLGLTSYSVVFPHAFILEVKFDHHFPMWIRPVLSEIGLKRRALSKYVLTVDSVIDRTHPHARTPFMNRTGTPLGGRPVV